MSSTIEEGSSQQPMPASRKRNRWLLFVGFATVVCCVGLVILGLIINSSPEYQATATAQAMAKATEAARSTNTPVPANTPVPTETPVPTNTTKSPAAMTLPTDTAVPPTNTSIPPTNTLPPAPEPTKTPSLDGAPQATQEPSPDVVIVEVFNAGYAEHVVIRNRGDAPADLSLWSLAESDNTVVPFSFPEGYTLAPGAEVRIYSGRDDRQNNPPGSFAWAEQNVWDNDGEIARLFDAQGKLVSKYRYR